MGSSSKDSSNLSGLNTLNAPRFRLAAKMFDLTFGRFGVKLLVGRVFTKELSCGGCVEDANGGLVEDTNGGLDLLTLKHVVRDSYHLCTFTAQEIMWEAV